MFKNLFFDKSKISLYLRIFIYFFVNLLFVVKYSADFRFGLSGFVPALIYLVLMISLFFLIERVRFSEKFFKNLFWISVVAFFVFIIFLNYHVDPKSLKVDRWSAMEVGINAFLEGKYPYTIPDHLGNKSSNLPVLILLGIPFYLLFGSVAYLQNLSFLIFGFIVFKFFKTYRNRFLALLFLILSPAYLYEIYTKSDLFSNFIIAAGVVLLLWKYFIKSSKISYEYVAVICAMLLLTRLPVLIPLVVLLFRKFYFFPLRDKIIFGTIFLISFFSVLTIFFVPAGSWEIIKLHNPFLQQNRHPFPITVGFFVFSVICSFRVKNIVNVLDYSSLVLFLSVLIAFLLSTYFRGFENTYFNSYFDISHFNIALPFIILGIPVRSLLNQNYNKEINF